MQEPEDRIASIVCEVGEMIHRRLGPGLDELCFDRTCAADIVVEVKAFAEQHPIHKAQVLTHTRLLNMRLGLVANFGLLLFKQGFQRAANGMPE